jgi:hypothetical protein
MHLKSKDLAKRGQKGVSGVRKQEFTTERYQRMDAFERIYAL